MKKISVIVPVYNAEAFIRQCVQSVICQTYRNLEILLIDDGSKDRSLEICRELSLEDARVKVYHQQNQGVSAARNYGLEAASGEYIFFLDSDDAIHPLLLEKMMQQAREQGAEMVFCNYVKIDGREMERVLKNAQKEADSPPWQIAEGEEVENWFHLKYTIELSRITGMISRGCIGTLRFDESLVNGEDTLFEYYLFCRQVRTAYSPRRWYYYRIHGDSIMHSGETVAGESYFASTLRIRDSEYQKGRLKYAAKWETVFVIRLREQYGEYKSKRDKKECKRLKGLAMQEREHPLFQALNLIQRSLFCLCFQCYVIYYPVDKIVSFLWSLKERWKGKLA